MIRTISVLTGQETVRDYTPEELQAIAAAQQADIPLPPPAHTNPVDKLKAFLVANPDVAAILK